MNDNAPAIVPVIRGRAEATARLARTGQIRQPALSPAAAARIAEVFGLPLTAPEVVERIVTDVAAGGDAAVARYTEAFDGRVLDQVEVPHAAWDAAWESQDGETQAALELAADRVRRFHQRQVSQSWFHPDELGILGQIVRPLSRIGIYTPGGSAPLPSSLLMIAVPARVAGVGEIIVAAPPGRDGSIAPITLAAARVAGVDRVFAVGGAQAIAAMAFGTESIPRVDKILGPGNIFVALAKQRVFGAVDIDQFAGPTETLLIADDGADIELIAADMLAQAEHDELASAILLTLSDGLAQRVEAELGRQLPELERESIARASLRNNGLIAVVDSLDDAVTLANHYAPEHLCLLVREPWALVPKVEHAGGIFIGEGSPEALGDYTAGPSHVMPTGGTARYSSPVNVRDFVKLISVAAANERSIEALGGATIALARAEGLTGHARAIELRLQRATNAPP